MKTKMFLISLMFLSALQAFSQVIKEIKVDMNKNGILETVTVEQKDKSYSLKVTENGEIKYPSLSLREFKGLKVDSIKTADGKYNILIKYFTTDTSGRELYFNSKDGYITSTDFKDSKK